jgi:hypothetical protein
MDNPNDAVTVKDRKPNNNDSGILKYLIAACVLGTAIGNMFVARKMKSFQHISSPFANASKTSSSSSNEDFLRRRFAEEQRRRERIRDFEYQREQTERIRQQFERKYGGRMYSGSDYPLDVQSALKVMEVAEPPKKLSKEFVKQLYQSMAMKYHPDRIPLNDKRKAEYDRKFKEIAEANRVLSTFTERQS